jgi:hypothetical protein
VEIYREAASRIGEMVYPILKKNKDNDKWEKPKIDTGKRKCEKRPKRLSCMCCGDLRMYPQ